MSLQENVNEQLKAAMKAKDTVALESLRAIKTAIMMTQTQAGAKALTSDDEIKLVQKLIKQRKDTLFINLTVHISHVLLNQVLNVILL